MSEKEPQYLYLTTIGRRSGEPRTIEIWFTEHEGRYYVIAEYATSNWVENIRADAAVRVRVGEAEFKAVARVIDATSEPELHARIQQLSENKYGWGDGLVVELAPVSRQGKEQGPAISEA
jgi:deazaflavin-dependent oxidoreductase (nitroreductase family)